MQQVLNQTQQQVFDYIIACLGRQGYPPSVREIAAAVGVKSSATVYNHLKALERAGLIQRDSSKPRAIVVVDRNAKPGSALPAGNEAPVWAQQVFSRDAEFGFMMNREAFLERINGDHLESLGLKCGDWAIIDPTAACGDGAVVLIKNQDGTFFRRIKAEESGRVMIDASSAAIRLADIPVLGAVTGVIRHFSPNGNY